MRLSVQHRIWGMVGLFAISLLLTGTLYVASERQSLLSEKKLKTRQLVELAVSNISHFHDLSVSGQMSEAEAKAAALQSIRAMRYGSTEYFWIQDAHAPYMVMHATQPKLDGQRVDIPQMPNVSAVQYGPEANAPLTASDGRTTLVIATNQLANTAGSGFVTYEWPHITPSGPTLERYPKLSFVEKFEPWDWVVGTGIFIDDIDTSLKEKAISYLGLLAIIGGSLALVATLLANSVVRPLRQATARLQTMSDNPSLLAPLPTGRDDEIGALIAGYNQLQAALRQREEGRRLAASVFDNAQEGIIITNAAGRIIQVNPAFCRLTGYSEAELIGEDPAVLTAGNTAQESLGELQAALGDGKAWQGELTSKHKDGSEFIERAYFTPVLSQDGKGSHFIGVIQDITIQKALASQLEQEAHHDYLTGLANRRHFISQAELEITRARRYNYRISVAMLDLDHFKAVNDSYGHEVGDQLLRHFGTTCVELLRDSDLIGRVGGEEFAISFPHMSAAEALEAVERLREKVASIEISGPGNCIIHFTVSTGIAELSATDRNIDELLGRADHALYEAKHSGRNRSAVAVRDPVGEN